MSSTIIDVSVCIPTFEEAEIAKYIGYLAQQTLYKQGRMEIVLADYNPTPESKTSATLQSLLKSPSRCSLNRLIYLDRKGIAYARHAAIEKSKGKVIVNFDADAYFTTNDAIERLTAPILRKEVEMTCCDNYFDTRALTREEFEAIRLINDTLFHLDRLQSIEFMPPLLEPGLTFSRESYNFVGGFPDVPQYEGAMLAAKIMHAYTPLLKKWIPDIAVIQSPRRALGAAKDGMFKAYGNYLESSYRS